MSAWPVFPMLDETVIMRQLLFIVSIYRNVEPSRGAGYFKQNRLGCH
jgi:hypothetical protein